MNRFFKLTVPSQNTDKKNKNKALIHHTKISVEIKGEKKINVKFEGQNTNLLEEEFKLFGKDMMEIANNCELFSLYFTSGIANSKIAFRPCAPNFCKIVDSLIPLIIHNNRQEKLFVNTLSLYISWKKELQNETIEEQITKLKYKQGNIKIDQSIKPII